MRGYWAIGRVGMTIKPASSTTSEQTAAKMGRRRKNLVTDRLSSAGCFLQRRSRGRDGVSLRNKIGVEGLDPPDDAPGHVANFRVSVPFERPVRVLVKRT